MRSHSNPDGSTRTRSRPSSIVSNNDDNLDEMLGRVRNLRETRKQILKDMAMMKDAFNDTESQESHQSKPLVLSWVINGWWFRSVVYGHLFWFSLIQCSAAQWSEPVLLPVSMSSPINDPAYRKCHPFTLFKSTLIYWPCNRKRLTYFFVNTVCGPSKIRPASYSVQLSTGAGGAAYGCRYDWRRPRKRHCDQNQVTGTASEPMVYRIQKVWISK